MSLALARLGVHHAVDVTDQLGGWTANRLWVGRWRRTDRLVFAKTISPTAALRHRTEAAAELANEIAVYRHLDGVGITPALVAATGPHDPDGPVLVLEHLDPARARFAPPLTARPGPHAATVDQVLDLIAKIADLPDRFCDPALDPPSDAAALWEKWRTDPPSDQAVVAAGLDPSRFARHTAEWADAAAGGWRAPVGGGQVAHVDLHPQNVAARADGTLIAVDWTDLAAGAADDTAHLVPGIGWAPAARWAPSRTESDGWAGPQTIHPLSAGCASWWVATTIESTAVELAGAACGTLTSAERLRRRRNYLTAAADLAACFGLPDLRRPAP